MLSKEQYEQLSISHERELTQEKKSTKIETLAVYLDQADELLSLTATITVAELKERQLLNKKIAEIDIQLDDFNARMTERLISSEQKLIELSISHTADYSFLSNKTYSPSISFIEDLTNELNTPIPNSDFRLSASIWGEDKRDAIYKFILKNVQKNVSPSELINILEDYLKKAGQGGAYYKAERVVDTEFQRAYTQSLVESTREFNEQNQEKLLIKRSLSPSHRVADICDNLVGVYDPKYKFPNVPSHPNDECLVSRIFVEDYSGDVRRIKNTSNIYTDPKYKTQVVLI